jgi:DNA-binding NtrC family response regulator
MPERVAILEDDPNRITAMRACLTETRPGVEVVVFEDAQEMIAWLGENLGEVVLISLDHDLPLRKNDAEAIDCGTGRQVADYLASVAPTCPVIVHSSNDNCATGMFFALTDAGWPCSRVYPCDDTAWIATAWAEQVRQYLRDGFIKIGGSD